MTPARDDVGNRVRRPCVRNVSADLDQSALADLLREIAVPTGVPGVMLVGGAGGLTIEQLRPCQELVGSGVLPLVAEARAVLIDGGTDSGVMAIAGRAREGLGSGFTRVGVVAGGTVRSPEGSAAVENLADLEANHTHILVVPGDTWGERHRGSARSQPPWPLARRPSRSSSTGATSPSVTSASPSRSASGDRALRDGPFRWTPPTRAQRDRRRARHVRVVGLPCGSF